MWFHSASTYISIQPSYPILCAPLCSPCLSGSTSLRLCGSTQLPLTSPYSRAILFFVPLCFPRVLVVQLRYVFVVPLSFHLHLHTAELSYSLCPFVFPVF